MSVMVSGSVHRRQLPMGTVTSYLCTYQGCHMVCFPTKNPDLGKNRHGLRLENVDIFYGHLEYFTDIWDIL
jgi:hypothetical protein